jgi:hypothetical protein
MSSSTKSLLFNEIAISKEIERLRRRLKQDIEAHFLESFEREDAYRQELIDKYSIIPPRISDKNSIAMGARIKTVVPYIVGYPNFFNLKPEPTPNENQPTGLVTASEIIYFTEKKEDAYALKAEIDERFTNLSVWCHAAAAEAYSYNSLVPQYIEECIHELLSRDYAEREQKQKDKDLEDFLNN